MNFNLAFIVRETAAAAPDRPVALYPGGRLSYAELDALSSRLAAYKYPRVFEFRDVLPQDTLGKVLKDELVPGRSRAAVR